MSEDVGFKDLNLSPDPKKNGSGENDDEKNKVFPIVYIGDDIAYFQKLQEQYSSLSSQLVEFQSLSGSDESRIQTLIVKIKKINPRLVIIDFTKNTTAMLHITRIWMRQNNHTDIGFIGLCDYNQGSSIIIKAIMTTMSCIHIKSSEYEAICYDINILAFPQTVADHGFATAKLNDPAIAYIPCKASLINDKFLKIESNKLLATKQQLRVSNFWSNNDIIKSDLFMCVHQANENLYYNYNYIQTLQMAHVDPVMQTEDMTPEKFDELKKKRTEDLTISRFSIDTWIEKHINHSKPKFLKALVIDKELNFFNNKPVTDSFEFVFRCQPYLKKVAAEIARIKPQLIIFNLEEIDQETLAASANIAFTFNNGITLQKVIDYLSKSEDGFKPIVIVFNTRDKDTATLQTTFNYKSILAVKEPMDVDLVLKMCQMLKAKVAPNLPQPGPKDIFIDKDSDVSYCEVQEEITIKSCSENDITFDCDADYEMGTVIRVNLPVTMYATIVPTPEFTKEPAKYYAIIHGVGEIERQKLRQYINDVFFRQLQEKKSLEKEEIEKTKKAFLDKQKEAQRLAEEEAKAEALAVAAEKAKAQDIAEKAAEITSQLGDDKAESEDNSND